MKVIPDYHNYVKKSNNLKDLRSYFFKYNDIIEDDFRENLTREVLKLDAELKEIELSLGRTYKSFKSQLK